MVPTPGLPPGTGRPRYAGPVPVANDFLGEGEEVLVDLRPHWMFLFGPAAVTVAVVAVAVTVMNEFPHAAAPVGWLLLVVVALPAFWLLGRTARWLGTSLVVTTSRLLLRRGVLGRDLVQLRLERINEVHCTQTLLERLLGTGRLVVEVGGEGGLVAVDDVRRPRALQRVLNTQIGFSAPGALGETPARVAVHHAPTPVAPVPAARPPAGHLTPPRGLPVSRWPPAPTAANGPVVPPTRVDPPVASRPVSGSPMATPPAAGLPTTQPGSTGGPAKPDGGSPPAATAPSLSIPEQLIQLDDLRRRGHPDRGRVRGEEGGAVQPALIPALRLAPAGGPSRVPWSGASSARYRCTACGNLTRFDVTTTRQTCAFNHYSVGGDLTVEDEVLLAESVDEVSCRWCGHGRSVGGTRRGHRDRCRVVGRRSPRHRPGRGRGRSPPVRGGLPGPQGLNLVPVPTYRDAPAATAADVVGRELTGQPLRVPVVGVDLVDPLVVGVPRTATAAECCGRAWPRPVRRQPAASAVVAVTRDADQEDLTALREVALARVRPVMSTAARRSYGVTGPPFFALIDGAARRVVTEGVAWGVEQTAGHVRRALGSPAPPEGHGWRPRAPLCPRTRRSPTRDPERAS